MSWTPYLPKGTFEIARSKKFSGRPGCWNPHARTVVLGYRSLRIAAEVASISTATRELDFSSMQAEHRHDRRHRPVSK